LPLCVFAGPSLIIFDFTLILFSKWLLLCQRL
jgi:hypothetical protein